jgi:MFS family permease
MNQRVRPYAAAHTDAGWRRATQALSNAEFRRVFVGNMAFFLGMGGQSVVRPWIAYELTDSPFALGIIAGGMAIPMFFLSPLGGALADRIERRGLIVFAQMLAIVTEAAVLGLYASDRIEFWHLVAASAFLGTCFPLMMPARTAIIFDLVERRDVGAAVGLNMTGVNATRVIGPAAAGLTIAQWGVINAYFVGLGLYLLAMLSMMTIRRLPPPPGRGQEPLMKNMTDGFRFLNQDRFVATLLLFGLVPQFLAMPFMNIMPAFAEDVWQVGADGFGILSAATGLGAVLGSFYVAGRRQEARRLPMMMASLIAFGALLIGFAASPWFWPAVILSALANVGASVFSTLNNVAIQLVIPDEVRGRVSSFLMMSVSLPLLGALPMGWVAEQVGPPLAVVGAATIAILSAVAFYVASPKLRGLDERVRASLEAES